MLFSTPKKSCNFLVLVRHVVTKHRSDLHLSSNLQVRSNVILSRVGAILLVSCTLQTRALVHTPRRNSAKKDLFGAEVEKNIQYEKNPLSTMVYFLPNEAQCNLGTTSHTVMYMYNVAL